MSFHANKNISGYYRLCWLLAAAAISPSALAAEELHWKAWLAGVMLISLAIGAFKSYRSEKAASLMAKLLLTGLYFWVFTFAQLIVLAVVYHFTR